MLIIIAITSVGCAKVISTEHKTVQVKIIDLYYKPEEVVKHITNINGKKKTNYTTKRAEYRVTVEYDSKQYNFRDKEYYYKAENKKSQCINGMLEIKTYGDKTSREEIIDIFVE
jgi:hypothetical protein